MRKCILVVLFILFSLLAPWQAFASNYGECGYGEGTYNNGGCSTSPTSPSSGSGSSDTAGEAPVCSADKPSSAPTLFQINSTNSSATLFFTPVTSSVDKYFISYGTASNAQDYGFEFVNNNSGVIAVEIKALKPATIYYYKVRAGNGCMPGDWSNELAARTGQTFSTYLWTSLPRIISTQTTRVIQPSSINVIEVDVTNLTPLPSPQPPAQAAPAPTIPPSDTTPSFMDRVRNFFNGLLGR